VHGVLSIHDTQLRKPLIHTVQLSTTSHSKNNDLPSVLWYDWILKHTPVWIGWEETQSQLLYCTT